MTNKQYLLLNLHKDFSKRRVEKIVKKMKKKEHQGFLNKPFKCDQTVYDYCWYNILKW